MIAVNGIYDRMRWENRTSICWSQALNIVTQCDKPTSGLPWTWPSGARTESFAFGCWVLWTEESYWNATLTVQWAHGGQSVCQWSGPGSLSVCLRFWSSHHLHLGCRSTHRFTGDQCKVVWGQGAPWGRGSCSCCCRTAKGGFMDELSPLALHPRLRLHC